MEFIKDLKTNKLVSAKLINESKLRADFRKIFLKNEKRMLILIQDNK
jgi:hypothetical protein